MTTVRIFYRPQYEDHICENGYVVFASSEDILKKWKEHSSIPLVEVLDGYEIYTTENKGVSARLDKPSNAQLHNDFGHNNVDIIIQEILRKGEIKGKGLSGSKFKTTNEIGGRKVY